MAFSAGVRRRMDKYGRIPASDRRFRGKQGPQKPLVEVGVPIRFIKTTEYIGIVDRIVGKTVFVGREPYGLDGVEADPQ
ncbi:MAG TPA: hypothetical protein VF439_03215, partial [Candidatus Paceibacterota bacterium]